MDAWRWRSRRSASSSLIDSQECMYTPEATVQRERSSAVVLDKSASITAGCKTRAVGYRQYCQSYSAPEAPEDTSDTQTSYTASSKRAGRASGTVAGEGVESVPASRHSPIGAPQAACPPLEFAARRTGASDCRGQGEAYSPRGGRIRAIETRARLTGRCASSSACMRRFVSTCLSFWLTSQCAEALTRSEA